MTIAKTILKKTHQEVVAKFQGAGTSAIALDDATDMIAAGQALEVGGTPTVNIVAVTWTGAVGSSITISRNSIPVLTLPGEGAASFDFNSQGYVDTINNQDDIDVVISGEAQLYLVLRKVAGYATKIETATFGALDDETAVGS